MKYQPPIAPIDRQKLECSAGIQDGPTGVRYSLPHESHFGNF